MIAQVLNRDTVLQHMLEVRDSLKNPDEARRGDLPPGAEGIVGADYEEALGALDSAIKREQLASSGQLAVLGPGVPSGRRSTPLDDLAFISHDPIVSLFQSALEMALEAGKADRGVNTPREEDDGRRGDETPVVTDQTVEGVSDIRDDSRRILDRFSITDPNWVSSLFAMGVRMFRKRRAFPDQRPQPKAIANNARVIIVADWATGVPRARKVARQMRASIEEGLAAGRQCHVVHLGDVYYSGFEAEYRKRFLRYWPVREAEEREVGSWCLNGNHDMYTGGHAYYDFLLADGRFRHWQGLSSFMECLNDSWRIIGLDTAWDDDGLKDPQADWVKASVGGDDRRKLLLLSHHQLFSAHENSADRGKVLRQKLGFLLGDARLRGWFWGHEHRCAVFEPNVDVPWAACIGHGGVPSYMFLDDDDDLVAPARYEYRKAIHSGLERWALMGYSILDFESDTIDVTFTDEDGERHFHDVIR